MTEPFGDPWVNPHRVQVESSTVTLWQWECFTCGKVEDGYQLLQHAEQDADAHATNAHTPAEPVAAGAPKCPICDGSGYASDREGNELGTCQTCNGNGRNR